jgi:hypothetical protein
MSRAHFLVLTTVASLAAACGDADSGGPGPGPDLQATLTAPTFATSRDSTQTRDLLLRNNEPVAALQVDLVAPADVIPSITAISGVARGLQLEGSAAQAVAPGRSRLLVFDPDGSATIPPGNGPVLSVTLRVDPSAPVGTHSLNLENGLVVSSEGETFELTLEAGEVTVR